MGALPTMINQDRTELALKPAEDRVWATALTLILLVLLLNLLARTIARFSTIKSK
jgi:phosphate transport system permease protein